MRYADDSLPVSRFVGTGRVTTTDQAQALENGVAQRHATLCDGLEHAGLDQARRALVASPVDMSWEWAQADQLVLAFSLQAGSYATAVLDEILRTTEPDRHTESEDAAGT
jgi:tRNA pseudouridine13 synthase